MKCPECGSVMEEQETKHYEKDRIDVFYYCEGCDVEWCAMYEFEEVMKFD